MNFIFQKIEHFIFGTNKELIPKTKSNRKVFQAETRTDEPELTDFNHSPFIPGYFLK